MRQNALCAHRDTQLGQPDRIRVARDDEGAGGESLRTRRRIAADSSTGSTWWYLHLQHNNLLSCHNTASWRRREVGGRRMHNCKGNQRLNLPADEQRIASRMVGRQLLLITLASPATSCSSRGTPPGALGRVPPAPGHRMDPPLERLPASTNPLHADPAAEPRRPRLHRPRYGLLPSGCARGSAAAATQSTGSLRNAIERLTSILQNIQPFVYPSETPHRFFRQDVLVRVRA